MRYDGGAEDCGVADGGGWGDGDAVDNNRSAEKTGEISFAFLESLLLSANARGISGRHRGG